MLHNTRVKIKLISGGKMPVYKTKMAAGADAFARLESPVIVKPNTIAKIPLGFIVELPEGYEMQIRSRSGLSLNHGIINLNAPGTVDADYRGEVCAIIFNCLKEDFTINNEDRVSQLVINQIPSISFEITDELGQTERGSDGFGSTGI